MTNEKAGKVAIPELREDRIIVGTRDQLLDHYSKMLQSREEADKELFGLEKEYLWHKKRSPAFPEEHHIIGRYQCAFEISQHPIAKQLDVIKDKPITLSGATTAGTFGVIAYCKYVKFKGVVENNSDSKTMPEIELSVCTDYVLVRPDDWHVKATAGL